jgi:Domain of unknown function (DUF4157)/Lysine-specific metallo-endopeptidase
VDGECAECRKKRSLAQVTVSQPGDRSEQEADRIAAQVMRMPEGPFAPASPTPAETSSTAHTTAELPSLDGGGRPLSREDRAFFEPRLGHDFSRVRIHAGSRAAEAAEAVQAQAFTIGHDVAFGAGHYVPGTENGKRLLVHELVHVVQQEKSGSAARLQRQPVPPPPAPAPAPAAPAAPPHYRDCTQTIAGVPNPDELLENGRQRAREYVGAAIGVLAAAPAAGTTYAMALAQHFIAPSDAQRATIAATYQQIRNALVVRNFICNSQNICGAEQAHWRPADDLIHVCRPFWALSPTCRAIVLVHEGAHDAGIGVAGAHPANRGDAAYPAGNVAAPAGQTSALRMDNPDAYSFFAAHIWRDMDTARTCF